MFFQQFDLKSFARLIICEGLQESTGDYNLGCKPVDFNDHTSHGFLQVTPGSVLIDFKNVGIKFDDEFDPVNTANFDTSNLKLQVLIWSWYTYNCVNAGVSLNEYVNRKAWNTQGIGGVTADYSNCQLVWLAGPRNDRHSNGAAAYKDYHDRITDYFVSSAFGTQADFENLINTSVKGDVKYVKNIA